MAASSPVPYYRRDSFFDALFTGLNPNLSSYASGAFETNHPSVPAVDDFDFFPTQVNFILRRNN